MNKDAASFLVQVNAGTGIFVEGESGQEMFIIQKGTVAIYRGPQLSGHPLTVLEEGDFFGEIAILEDVPREVTAVAQTDCELIRIDRGTFHQLVRYNPEVPIRMLRKLSRRLRQLIVASEAPIDPVEAPIASAAAAPQEGSDQVPIPFVSAHLEHPETGTVFPLSSGEQTWIGRFDPVTGFRPDIELKQIDIKRSTSRRHARILRRESRHFVVEEIGVANGTFVKGRRISTGEEVEIFDGDEVTIGYVVLIFHTE